MRMPFRSMLTTQSGRDRVLFCAPIVAALVLLALFVENGSLMASAWRSPLSVLSDRSPGLREAGALYSIKPERFKPVMNVPQERVLGIARERPETLAVLLPEEAPPMNLMMDEEPVIEGPSLVDFDVPRVNDTPEFRPTTSPGCCVRNRTFTAVPEPGTWLLNIVGLFAVGGAMRYRKRKIGGSLLPLRG